MKAGVLAVFFWFFPAGGGAAEIPLSRLPSPPAGLLAPLELEVISAPLPGYEFRWLKVPDNRGYWLEVSPDADFRGLALEVYCPSESFFPGALEPGTWHWRVRTRDAREFEGPPGKSGIFLYLPGDAR